MDHSEAAVKAFLVKKGFSNIVYEPDGNIPPDFLINGEIAVEVRRLNQNFDDGTGMRGLEEVSASLLQRMTRLVECIAETDGNSWFVWFRFSRPVPLWNSLAPALREALLRFRISANKRDSTRVIYSAHNFEVRVREASRPLETFFRIGSMSDHQAGGSVVAEFISNIQHCSAEKLVKIERHRNKYKTWWLALTNKTGLGLDEFDRQQLQQNLSRPAGWDKILLIIQHNPESWIEF